MEVEFFYEGKNVRSKFLITSEKYPNVLDRDVLGTLCLNWKELLGVLIISDCATAVVLKIIV